MNTSTDKIFIITQAFYGNRTATKINREEINFFLRGILSPEFLPDGANMVDRKVVRVPNTENLVIVYDQTQEDERIASEHTKYVSCEISEIGLKLHTRCFACRIDENGELQSLEAGDGEKFIEYFTP